MSKNVWLFDCDGTLLNDDKEMTEKTREAIKNLANTPDNYVVFASGRSYEGVKAICEKLGMMDEFQYYICFNGCQTINNKDTEHPVTMTNTLMDPETAEKVVAMAKEAGIPCYAITPDHVYEEENIKEASTEAGRNKEPIIQHDLSNMEKDEGVVKVVLSIPEDPDKLQKFYEGLDDNIKSQYTIIRPDDHNMEFLHKDAGKAPAMQRLKELFNADYTISFGDAGNDYDMIRDADFGVCMGNGAPECKDVAYIVTADNNHDGIVPASEMLLEQFRYEELLKHGSVKDVLGMTDEDLAGRYDALVAEDPELKDEFEDYLSLISGSIENASYETAQYKYRDLSVFQEQFAMALESAEKFSGNHVDMERTVRSILDPLVPNLCEEPVPGLNHMNVRSTLNAYLNSPDMDIGDFERMMSSLQNTEDTQAFAEELGGNIITNTSEKYAHEALAAARNIKSGRAAAGVSETTKLDEINRWCIDTMHAIENSSYETPDEKGTCLEAVKWAADLTTAAFETEIARDAREYSRLNDEFRMNPFGEQPDGTPVQDAMLEAKSTLLTHMNEYVGRKMFSSIHSLDTTQERRNHLEFSLSGNMSNRAFEALQESGIFDSTRNLKDTGRDVRTEGEAI